ncbi:MAG: erythromycin biosynthesis sensory transduction protein eryC1 [Terriglobia bacterium]|nr:MAG: erythromycin biosynthesis sensory transduction protein eryC1 [Terriglobia bacterium]
MIPMVDLKAQYHSIKQEIDSAIAGVLESSQFVLGREVAAFEAEFAAYCGAPHAIGVNSGTSALHLALLAAGLGPGDEVITVPFTFVASVAAIVYTGARPVFVDIDAQSYTMAVAQIEAAISPRTKAILPVHLYGQPADMDPILEIAKRHRLAVIEDAAQAHGALYKGRPVGTFGELGCFSFYPGKNLGAYGEAGAVVTRNPEHARMVRMLRDWGSEKKYEHLVKGYNYRMEGMQGAILRVKLRHLDRWTEARREHAAQYARLLETAGVRTPQQMAYARHVYTTYTIRTEHRGMLREQLESTGIQTAIHYPIPVHMQPAYADLGYRHGDFPVSEQAAREVLSLPLFPEMTSAQLRSVAEALTLATARAQV